jgi:enoyl-CoA hydratase/carnithine racemase
MTIELQKSGRVATIVLNRPDKHNAMTPRMAAELAEVTSAINLDASVAAVILRGAGERAFSSGSDLKALDEYSGPWHFRNRVDYPTQIRNLRKPVIAAIKGWALGGGLEMALAADIRFAAPSARFGAPEVKHGWVGAGGASQLLPRLIGYGKASYMLLRGEPIDADLALQWGLIERLVDEDTLYTEAASFAEEIANNSEVALMTMKSSIRQSLSAGLAEGLAYENEVMALAFALGNDTESREAFKKRQKP